MTEPRKHVTNVSGLCVCGCETRVCPECGLREIMTIRATIPNYDGGIRDYRWTSTVRDCVPKEKTDGD